VARVRGGHLGGNYFTTRARLVSTWAGFLVEEKKSIGKAIEEDGMSKRLVFLYDSTIQPWHADLQAIQANLTKLKAKGVRCEFLDTKDMPEQELDRWRDEAMAAAIWRHQGIRQAFGSRKQGRLPYLGKQVPALLVYEEGEKIPVAVYPHSEKRGRTHTDFSIEGFLEELVNSLRGR